MSAIPQLIANSCNIDMTHEELDNQVMLVQSPSHTYDAHVYFGQLNGYVFNC